MGQWGECFLSRGSEHSGGRRGDGGGGGGALCTGDAGQRGGRPPFPQGSPVLTSPSIGPHGPPALTPRVYRVGPSLGTSEQTHSDLSQKYNLFQRGERLRVPSAPAPRLQTHCAALIFSKKRAFPLQHAFCGKLCFLLTSGTDSVWHVWRDCSPFEPLPC